MNLKKIALYSLAFLFLLTAMLGYLGIQRFNNMWFADRPNHLELTSDLNPIKFQWSQGQYGEYHEKHEAIIILGNIEGAPTDLKFQFDTGSPSTLLYENTLKSLGKRGLTYNVIEKDGNEYVEELSLDLGGSKIKVSMIEILKAYGKVYEADDKVDQVKLGSIGADFLEHYITEIDFSEQKIKFYEERQDWMTANQKFQAFNFKGNRFMLGCEIDGKQMELFYDSGSSAFGLITSKQRYKRYSNSANKEICLSADSWGSPFPICHKATEKRMSIGGANVSLKRISYVDMYGNFQWIMTPFTSIGGWLGNKPFTDCSLIFDTKRSEFLVYEKK